jgi:hypothetical protein
MLTVKQVIEILSRYPENYLVIVDGYEGGYDTITESNIGERQCKGSSGDPYCGALDDVYAPETGIRCLLISRNS